LSYRIGLDLELGGDALVRLALDELERWAEVLLTELAATTPQSHGKLWLFGSINIAYGAVGCNHFPPNDALTGGH
jgi:hypothetical protein